ncbi:hypothetical protein MMC30_004564 [Trapelia coarctata]|nr:hypothetical protein [Trapelia coarctata]
MSSTLLTSIATVDSIVPFFLAHGLLAFALAYTQPSSAKRPFILLLIALCCLASVRSSISRSIPGEIGGEYVIGFIFHASHFLCLVKLSPPHGSTCSGRWAWAINQLFEARWGVSKNLIPAFSKNSRRNRAPSDGRQQHSASLKLSSQEKKIPGSETAIEDDKEARPSPRTLFLHRLWDLLWTVSVISFLKCHKLAVFSDDITSVPDGFLHRLAEVDAREWVIRIYMTLLSIVLPYCTLRAAHSLASCLSIAFGDLPHRWPPLFGNIEDAYTVRRFYA